jgi:hypothetical protein
MTMKYEWNKPDVQAFNLDTRDRFDLDALLHPASAYALPSDVVNDPDLTLNEKRSILASWASDACAIEAAPSLRQNPAGRLVSFDEVMDALGALDRQAAKNDDPRRYQKAVRRRALFGRGRRGGTDQDSHPQ